MGDTPRASAAAVAAQLLEFYREPAVQRPRYLHGQVPMPDGPSVLKLALGHFSRGWQRDIPAREREDVRTAARAFVRQVCLWERASHYQVLCLSPGAGDDAIRETYRLLMALIHPDRAEASTESWPADSAQRVNQAYATLSDAASRATYDAQLQRSTERAVLDAAARMQLGAAIVREQPRSGLRVQRLARRSMVLMGMVLALYLVQSWWFVERPRQALEGAFALQASERWTRDARGSEPRFLGAPTPVRLEPLPELQPVKELQRSAVPATPAPEAPSVLAQAQASPATTREASATPASPPGPSQASSQGSVQRTEILARESSSAAAPIRLAQAGGAAIGFASGPSAEQVETLVAQLVGSYDTGDADRLMGLLDGDEFGFWKGWRTRSAYADFFGATRQRRLRMNRLDWRSSGETAQARGEATVIAEYADGRPRLERTVPVELDITIRSGQARITRLILFPGGQ